MIDINLIRTNRDLVKENIKKKFQDKFIKNEKGIIELKKYIKETKNLKEELILSS